MKKFLPVVLVLIVLLLAGVGFYLFGRQDTSPSSKEEGGAKTVSEGALPQGEEKGSVIGSIKDAMGLGKKMKCTYSAKDGSGVSSTIFVDGQKYKSMTEINGEQMYGLFDGEMQYTWTTGKEKQGWKMSKTCLDELGEAAPKMTEDSNDNKATPQDFQASFEGAQNVQCEAAAGEDFSVPTDIVFVDQCEMLKNSMKAFEEMKDKIPGGFNVPGY